jgi:hypothetical protein
MRTDGRTDRHAEPNSRSSKFCERAYKRDASWNQMFRMALNLIIVVPLRFVKPD